MDILARMAHAPRASMIVIGDEILDGHTQDTNSGWTAGWLAERGVPLDRIVTVPDECAAIGETLEAEMARGHPRLVLTSGGIGSTPDDLTMAAVANHLGMALTAEPTLDARISQWVQRAEQEGMPIPENQQRAMRKMAQVPGGAYLLEGARGVTPGVAIDLDGGIGADGVTLVILPGVPSELERIVEDGVAGLLTEVADLPHVAELRHPYPESALSPLFAELVDDHPDVKVGSYPGKECVVRMKGPEAAVTAAMRRVRERLAVLDDDAVAQRMRERWQARWE